MSRRSKDFSSISSVKTDLLRETLSSLLHTSSEEERTSLIDKIAKLRKEINQVNDQRRSLAKFKSELEDAQKSLKGTPLENDPLAEMVIKLSIDDLQSKIAELRPEDLLAAKASLQTRLNFLTLRWKAAEQLLKALGEIDG